MGCFLFKAHDVTFEIKSQQDKQDCNWNNYTFKLRNDLPDYGLKFDDAQGIFLTAIFKMIFGSISGNIWWA